MKFVVFVKFSCLLQVFINGYKSYSGQSINKHSSSRQNHIFHPRKQFQHQTSLNLISHANLISKLIIIRDDPWYVWTILSLSSTIGILAEKTNIGATLSSPLITTITTMILCNLGLLPMTSSVYTTVMRVLVPLAIPLLLLDADLKKCFKSTGSLLKAFLVGTIGTIVGQLSHNSD